MSLSSNVQVAISSQRLIELTNAQDEAQTSVNATRLALACTLAEAEFKIHAGTTYDDSDARHVTAGIKIVEIKLLQWIGQRSAEEADRFIKEALEDVGLVTGRNRILPQSDAVFTPTSRQVDDETVVPDMDWPKFRDGTTDGPGSADTLGS